MTPRSNLYRSKPHKKRNTNQTFISELVANSKETLPELTHAFEPILLKDQRQSLVVYQPIEGKSKNDVYLFTRRPHEGRLALSLYFIFQKTKIHLKTWSVDSDFDNSHEGMFSTVLVCRKCGKTQDQHPCPKCGTVIGNEFKFCTECGTENTKKPIYYFENMEKCYSCYTILPKERIYSLNMFYASDVKSSITLFNDYLDYLKRSDVKQTQGKLSAMVKALKPYFTDLDPSDVTRIQLIRLMNHGDMDQLYFNVLLLEDRSAGGGKVLFFISK